MKNLLLITIFTSLSISLFSQTEMTLLGTWTDTMMTPTSQYNNPFNEVWGVTVNNREYAILGSTYGTHFIDVTDPTNPEEISVVKGGSIGSKIVHRDFHDYKGYLYSVCQEGTNSSLQIIDMKYLPDSVSVVYDSRAILDRTHNIFIDSSTHKLYVLLALSPTLGYAAMRILDISNPIEPVLLADHSQFGSYGVGHVHDAYVRNDTAYLNCGPQGLVIADFADPVNPTTIAILPTADYEQSGYNHSGWLTEDGKYYVMADETHNMDMKIIDVQNLPELEVVSTISPEDTLDNIPHNQIIKGDYLYSSYYYDGLQVWNIADPINPVLSHYYDTSPVKNAKGYAGAWGVYTHLPSGNILVSDMQLGLFVLKGFDNSTIGTYTTKSYTEINIFPNPTTDFITIDMDILSADATILLYDNYGNQLLRTTVAPEKNKLSLDIPSHWASGLYHVIINQENEVYRGSFTVIK